MRITKDDPRWKYHPRAVIRSGRNLQIWFDCGICTELHIINVDKTNLLNWLNGKSMQEAFPDMHPSQRELFLSGYCGPCFESIFKEESS